MTKLCFKCINVREVSSEISLNIVLHPRFLTPPAGFANVNARKHFFGPRIYFELRDTTSINPHSYNQNTILLNQDIQSTLGDLSTINIQGQSTFNVEKYTGSG